ncbi:MAG: NAD-dependent epimerase/dehydratase family protein [Myxococcaceae bacterium]
MRVLVTGASGFLGTHLCRRLAQRGDEVVALVRKRSADAGLNAISASQIEGDVSAPESIDRAMKGVEIVFHLAGIRRSPSREPFFQVNAEGTRNVCESMVRAKARRLVHAGSLSSSGPSSADRPRREDDPFNPQEWYGESKVEAERIVNSFNDRLETTIIRPARILGPGDRENLAFFKIVKKGIKLRLGGGPRPLSMVDAEDVVDQMLLQADKKEAVGQAFFSAADETTTMERLQDVVADELKVKTRTIFLPPIALTALANAADVFSNATGKHLPLNRKLAKQLLAPAWTCSMEKAHRLLGFNAKRGLEESIRESGRWYVQHGWL